VLDRQEDTLSAPLGTVDAPSDQPLLFLSGRLQELGWIDWEAEHTASIFDPGSGETHLINALPAEILRLVGNDTRELRSIAADLAEDSGLVCDDAWIAAVRHSARSLCDIDLLAMLTGRNGHQIESPSP
jgi:hypothetical protein